MSSKPIAIEIGARFGKWTVLETGHKAPNGSTQYYRAALCACECGSERVVPITLLVSGHTRGCRACQYVPTSTTHGLSSHRMYPMWVRRRNEFSDEWQDVARFIADISTMERPSRNFTLAPIDADAPIGPATSSGRGCNGPKVPGARGSHDRGHEALHG